MGIKDCVICCLFSCPRGINVGRRFLSDAIRILLATLNKRD